MHAYVITLLRDIKKRVFMVKIRGVVPFTGIWGVRSSFLGVLEL